MPFGSSGRAGLRQARDIEHCVFRANASYELVLFDRLTAEHQEALAPLRRDPDFYGILRPQPSSGLTIKALSRETALLFLTLREPGPLPEYARSAVRERAVQLEQLVLDGVLEIEHEGGFVTGGAAHRFLYAEPPSTIPAGRTAALSIDALKYGQSLHIEDIAKLSARLYFYNRVPASPAWKQRLSTEAAVDRYLGLTADGLTSRTLRDHWSIVPAPVAYEGWLTLESRHARLRLRNDHPTYKLYMSPHMSHVAKAVRAAVQVFTLTHTPIFKIGHDVFGLLRPDKIVAYFWSFEQLQEVAERLAREAEGCPAHGVPFTAAIDADGLLSWGIDPPPDQHLFGWRERESWRLWVTNRLATALLTARSAASSMTVEPWQFALERLQLDGVDTSTWTPSITLWHGSSSAARP